MKLFFSIVIGILVSVPISAQEKKSSSPFLFLHKLGGKGYEFNVHLLEAPSGFNVIGDTRGSFGNTTDSVLYHINDDGDVKFSNTLGGTHKDTYAAAQTTASGNTLLILDSQSLFFTFTKIFHPSMEPRPVMICLDPNFKILWAKDFNQYVGYAYNNIVNTKDAYYVTGTNSSGELILAKISMNGEVAFQKKYFQGIGKSLLTRSGNLLMTGYHHGKKKETLFISVANKSGELKTAFRYSSPSGNISIFNFVQSSQGDIFGIGYFGEESKKYPLLTKFSEDGNIEWAKAFMSDQNIQPISLAHVLGDTLLVSGVIVRGKTDYEGVHILMNSKGEIKSINTYADQGIASIDASHERSNKIYFAGMSTPDTKGKADFVIGAIDKNKILLSNTSKVKISINKINLKEEKISLKQSEDSLSKVRDLPAENISTTEVKNQNE
jgi:hypothetical protein